MSPDDLEFHLDANGEGEVRLPMGSSMAHLRAVKDEIGPDFKIVADDDYDPMRPYEVFKIRRRQQQAGHSWSRKTALAAASVVMTTMLFKVAGLAWEHSVQIAQYIQEFA